MKSTLRLKIQQRLDTLELAMIADKHTNDEAAAALIEQTEGIAKFWPVLRSSERDFIHCVRHAITNKIKWNV